MSLRDRFDEANVTSDGRLTKEQAKAAGMKQLAANFDAIDVDKAGYISFDQAKAFKKEKKAKVQKVQSTKAKIAERNERKAHTGGASAQRH